MKSGNRWLGSVALLVISLLAAEGVLQFVAKRFRRIDVLLSPNWAVPPQFADSILGLKGNPRWFDHDSLGLRNAEVPGKVDIVTMGDSHTYGVGVAHADNWPSLLASATGKSVYNMAFLGWGPGQGYLVLRDALSHQPAVVVFGLYFGNDFLNTFDLASRRPELRHFLPLALHDTSAALEAREPIVSHVNGMFPLTDTTSKAGAAGTTSSIRRYLSEHSRVYGLARALRSKLERTANASPAPLSRNLERALAEMTREQRTTVAAYRGPEWSTLLTSSYRNMALDDHDPRIRAGIEGTEAILAAMEAACQRDSVRFLVVLLPTKESVFAARIGDLTPYAGLDSLVTNEARAHDEIIVWLARQHTEYLDALPALRLATTQPYFSDADGHPNEAGHHAIAQAVGARLRPPAPQPRAGR